MKKKNVYIIICLTMLFILTACGQNPGTDEKNAEPDVQLQNINLIVPYEFTNDEKELLELINPGIVNIYDFSVDDFTNVSIWWEEYENGQLTYTSIEKKSGIAEEGKIAIVIDSHELQIHIQGDGGIGTITPIIEDAKGSRSLIKQTEIVADTEIALVVQAFNNGDDNAHAKSPNLYIENPERLNDFDRVYLFKCRFSEEAVD